MYATKLVVSILSSDLEQVMSLPIKTENTKEIADYRFENLDKQVLVKLTYEIHMPWAIVDY